MEDDPACWPSALAQDCQRSAAVAHRPFCGPRDGGKGRSLLRVDTSIHLWGWIRSCVKLCDCHIVEPLTNRRYMKCTNSHTVHFLLMDEILH